MSAGHPSPKQAVPVRDMDEAQYLDFVRQMVLAVFEGCGTHEIALGVVVQSVPIRSYGPWLPTDCAHVMRRFIDAGWVEMTRYRWGGGDHILLSAEEVTQELDSAAEWKWPEDEDDDDLDDAEYLQQVADWIAVVFGRTDHAPAMNDPRWIDLVSQSEFGS